MANQPQLGINAINIMQPKAEAIASVLAPRLASAEGEPWAGYHLDEKLVGAIMQDGSVKYWRRHEPAATMYLAFLEYVSIEDVDKLPVRIVSKDITEIKQWDVDVEKGTTWENTYTHTFTKAKTEAEGFKDEWTLAAKAYFSIEEAGIKGGAEVSGGYLNDTTKNLSTTETTSDTESSHIIIVGPKHGFITAERSKNVEERTLTVAPSVNFKTYFNTKNNGAYQFDDFRDTFLAQLKGEEPEYTDFTKFAANSTIREVMQKQPLTHDELASLLIDSDQKITLTYTFDNITAQGIHENIKDGDRPEGN